MYSICGGVNTMDDNDIEYAVKLYRESIKNKDFNAEVFAQKIVDHKRNRKMPFNTFDPLSFYNAITKLWNCLEMSMREIINKSGMDMAKLSRRFCIPYRTLQSWCDGTNPCPIYVKLMICEILRMMPSRTVYAKGYRNVITGEIIEPD